MGSEYGGEESIEETVDFPVAIEPVRPRRSILVVNTEEDFAMDLGLD